jgi:AcrR family transcriptional regulator
MEEDRSLDKIFGQSSNKISVAEQLPGHRHLSTPKSERTKERILRVAERLFAEHGYEGVSMRELAAAAGVQLALLSYYFRNKLGVYRAVFERRIAPISDQRRAALRQVLERTDPPPSIEGVLDALARPWVELRGRRGGEHYSRLIAREVGDPQESRRGIVADMLDPIAVEFINAMEKVLPEHTRAQVHWAYHFFIAALLLILANPARAKRLSGRLCRFDDSEALISEIVGFFTACLSTPAGGNKRQTIGGYMHEARHVPRAQRPPAQRRAR